MTNQCRGRGLYQCCHHFAWTVNSSREGGCLPISSASWGQCRVGPKISAFPSPPDLVSLPFQVHRLQVQCFCSESQIICYAPGTIFYSFCLLILVGKGYRPSAVIHPVTTLAASACQSPPPSVIFTSLDSEKVTETNNRKCLFASPIIRTMSGAVKFGDMPPPHPQRPYVFSGSSSTWKGMKGAHLHEVGALLRGFSLRFLVPSSWSCGFSNSGRVGIALL